MQSESEMQALPMPERGEGVVTSTGSKYARIEFPPKKDKPAYRRNPAVTFSFDPYTKIMHYKAEVEPGMWLSVGWGWHMFDCDMWLCQAYPDLRRSLISDLWSTHNTTPLFDTLDNYFDNHIDFDEETGM